jgi:hypothetical protein
VHSIQLAMDNKAPRAALDIAKTIQTQRPKEAVGYLFEGNIHASAKAWPEAMSAFRQGLKADQKIQNLRSNFTVRILGIWKYQQKQTNTANSWLKDHPKDVAFRMYLGDLVRSKARTTLKRYRPLPELL